MTDRGFPRVALLVLGGALLFAFYRLLLGEVFFWGLPALQFVPWRDYAFDLLRQGHLPLWNSLNGAGAPLLANYQSALLYPLNWLGLVLPLPWQMSVTAALHLFIAGWGMWAFTGRLGLPDLGRGISALAFGMTSYLVARLGTYPTITAAAWLPWLLWAALGVLTRSKRQDIGWLGLFAGLQLLAGHAQTTWYSLLLVGLFSAWWTGVHRPFNWRRLALVLGGLALGAGIAAAQLLPTAELLRSSQRSTGVDYDFAMNFSYGPARTLNLLSPNFFGNPGDGSYATKGAFFEDAVYVGLIPLVSALAAALSWAWGRLRRRERPAYFMSASFWLLIVVVAFVLALGKNTPIFPFLYENVPTFGLFQAPVRWHLWTVAGLSVLAGIGVGAWGHGKWLFFWTRLVTAGCVGAALLAVGAPRFLPPDTLDNEGVQAIMRAVTATGILGALAGVLTLTQPEITTGRRYRLWTLAAWLVLAGDLVYAAQGLNPTVNASFYTRLPQAGDSSERGYWPGELAERETFTRYLQFDDYRVAVNEQTAFRATGLENLNLLDRAALLNNFDPLLIGSYSQYLALIEANPTAGETLLRAAGVTHMYTADGQRIALDNAGQRAWLVGSVCWHTDEASLTAGLLDPAWDPVRQAHLVGEGECPAPDDETAGSVTAIVDAGNSLTVQLEAARDGWLIVADTPYPGWTVNGQPVQTANINMRAVPVSAGAQSIAFEYSPWWSWPGALITLVALIITLALFRSQNPE